VTSSNTQNETNDSIRKDLDNTSAQFSDEADLDAVFDQLAVLSPIEYDRTRDAKSKELGCRPSTLDREVESRRNALQAGGSVMVFENPEPWPDPVNGDELLSFASELFRKYVVMDDVAADACALWVVNSYTHEINRVSPILAITSPDKRCGKTTLLELLSKLCCRPLSTSHATPAAIFRAVEQFWPTILFDEGDLSVEGDSDIRCILNSAHTRSGAYVLRCVGDGHEMRRFSTWSPKVIAAIGSLAPTLHDRSIHVRLKRKKKVDTVDRLRNLNPTATTDLCSQLARWAKDNVDSLAKSRPELPEELHDRAQDNWEPMLAIADQVGMIWPERARKAAIELSSGDLEDDAIGVRLLRDIQIVLDKKGVVRIHSSDLLEELLVLDEGPWINYKGKGISTSEVARLLRQFDVKSKQLRIDGLNRHGYEAKDFGDPFSRYLKPIDEPFVAATPLHQEGDDVDVEELNVTESAFPLVAT
jgi:putative DNA primase/helicase